MSVIVFTTVRAAAAVALYQVTSGTILAAGSLGHLLSQPRHVRVYGGDRSAAQPGFPDDADGPGTRPVLPGFGPCQWDAFHRELARFMETARTAPSAARQILHVFSSRCRTQTCFEEERCFLIG
ncbi:hypothetical protein [Actinomadura roseirufa]|uniref:hypothetical protein n=1 Tax=Actinomadura roseirufa TaxID=2094049 RepID=UPI001041B8E3|nr:hypothetical protein [Actinomadura roseirufa]